MARVESHARVRVMPGYQNVHARVSIARRNCGRRHIRKNLYTFLMCLTTLKFIAANYITFAL